MDASEKRGPGRPPKPEGEAKRASYQARIRETTKAFLEGEASQAGRSLSEEIEVMGEERMAYPNRAPLLHLFEQLARVVDPRDRWRENSPLGEASRQALAVGLHHAMQRLAHPDDAHVYRDGGIQAQVDQLIWDLGNDASEHRGPLLHVHHWAAGVRRYLGPLGPLLVRMRQSVREHLEALPAEPLPAVDSERAEILDRARAEQLVKTAEHHAAEAAARRARRQRREGTEG
jgi:hypothetical protein